MTKDMGDPALPSRATRSAPEAPDGSSPPVTLAIAALRRVIEIARREVRPSDPANIGWQKIDEIADVAEAAISVLCPPESTSDERNSAGIVWMDICRKFADAKTEHDESRAQALHVILKALEEEYPKEIAAEKRRWSGETSNG